MSNRLYITTTIPYVNAPPHIGFALELVQADAIARYHRLLGKSVRFQTGTDENAFKNVLSARDRGIPVERFVAGNAARFRSLGTDLGISVDRFLRTTEDAHVRAVNAFLARLGPDDLYVADYRGLYCTGCEDFYLERDLVGQRCPEHDSTVIETHEHNHFFRLSRYQDQISNLIATGRLRIVPEEREAEVLRFVERGLADITRTWPMGSATCAPASRRSAKLSACLEAARRRIRARRSAITNTFASFSWIGHSARCGMR